jgi:hypothetical protein
MLLDAAGLNAPATIPCAALAFHRRLAEWNVARASTVFDAPDWLTSLQAQYRMQRLEHDFVGAATASVRRFAREAPSDPERFSSWFSRLDQLRSSQTDALFVRLGDAASQAQLRWYLDQHAVAEAGFAELSALTQEKLTRDDGNGSSVPFATLTKGDRLACLGQALAFVQAREGVVWEALAVSNLMVAFAANRRFSYHAAGALAVAELAAVPQRAAIERGLRRLGLPFELAHLAHAHGASAWSWCNDALPALVAADPAAASQIAEGALSRLAANARYHERCQRELDRIPDSLETLCPPELLMPAAPEIAYAS